jgi:hypothetical protein
LSRQPPAPPPRLALPAPDDGDSLLGCGLPLADDRGGLHGSKQKAVDRLNVLGVYVTIDVREQAETVVRGLREGVI